MAQERVQRLDDEEAQDGTHPDLLELLIDLGLGAAFYGAFQWSGMSEGLARWWAARVANEPLLILGYLTVFGLTYYFFTLPLHFYGSFLLEHRFGLSRLTLTGWGIRELKRIGVSAVLGSGLDI